MSDNGEKFSGNIFLFYSYDIGDEIDLEDIRSKKVLNELLVPLSPYFKNYNIPLSFEMPENVRKDDFNCIISKVYRFGVLSFCYKLHFEEDLEELKLKLINIYNKYKKQSDLRAKVIFDKILKSVEKPAFYHLKNSYYVVQVEPPEPTIQPELFKKKYGDKIASILRLERTRLSGFQSKNILATTTGYSGNDFLIIDDEASFVYDDEVKELLEFFELASIQQLELQYFDRLLNARLESHYLRPYKIPFTAYIPFVAGRINLPAQQLARLRVDISVITERLESSINMAGDAYYSHVYSMLVDQLSIRQWKKSIDSKLDIIRDLYTAYQHQLDTVHAELLEVIIIILIALELIMPLVRSN